MNGTTTLMMEPHRLVLVGPGLGEVIVPLGPDSVSARWRHSPPTGPELEHAIDVIEDAVMATRLVQARRGSLTLVDSSATIGAAGLPCPAEGLGLAEVEARFQRLAAAASGPVSVLDGVPADAASAARLLILRELMHHLGFDRLLQAPAR